jgi:CRP/FNR family transcriptional regulator, cyclic AMP receptor protein
MEKLIPLEEDTTNNKSVLDYVKGMKFFSDLDQDELESVTQWVKPYKAELGTTVFEEGNQSPHLCLIAEGEISIFKKISDSEYIKVADIKAGGSIGEMGILDGEPVSASAIASVESVVFTISGEDFKKLVSENESLGVKLLWKIGKIISLRLRKTTGLLAEISIAKSDD